MRSASPSLAIPDPRHVPLPRLEGLQASPGRVPGQHRRTSGHGCSGDAQPSRQPPQQVVSDTTPATVDSIVHDRQVAQIGVEVRSCQFARPLGVRRYQVEPLDSAALRRRNRCRTARRFSIASVTLGSGDSVSSGTNFTPLYSGGLCDAVTITPPARSRSVIAYATVGVGTSRSDTKTSNRSPRARQQASLQRASEPSGIIPDHDRPVRITSRVLDVSGDALSTRRTRSSVNSSRTARHPPVPNTISCIAHSTRRPRDNSFRRPQDTGATPCYVPSGRSILRR